MRAPAQSGYAAPARSPSDRPPPRPHTAIDKERPIVPARSRVFGLIAVLFVAGACTGGRSTSGGAPSAPGSGTIVATVPANQLATPGTLTICSDTSNPPQEFLDSATQKPTGSDIELAAEIAARMGLRLEVRLVSVDAIIPALTSGECDIGVSALAITPVRQQQVEMIPYFEAGQSFVVLKGNPLNIGSITDLCGKPVAVRKDSVEADRLNPTGQGDYRVEEGLTARCKAAGKPAISSVVVDLDAYALPSLKSGTVAAHFVAEAVAGYEVSQGADAFEMLPSLTLDHLPQGIGVANGHPWLRDAVKACLKSMLADGTYDQILAKWGLASDRLTTPLD